MSNPLSQSVIEAILAERFLLDIPADIRQQVTVDNPLWLAVSGGRDSMALLCACQQLNLPIHVIHVNHQLQSPSDAWQALVADFCQKNAIAFTAVLVDWQTFFKAQNLKQPYPDLADINEQHARQARYQAMIGIIKKQCSPNHHPIIALAHHANDQAETMLLNLCQGTGVTGLAGMKSWTLQQEFSTPIWLWRPLLTVSREQISDYVVQNNLPFIDDPTNIAGDNQRAFLRQQILPKLAERFGNVIQNISRTRQNMAEVVEIIDEQVQADSQACKILSHSADRHWDNPSLQQRLSIPTLQQLPQARRLQILRHWVKGEQKFTPNREFVLQVNKLIMQDNPDQQTLLYWQGFAIRRYRDSLYRLAPHYLSILKQQKIKLSLSNNLKQAQPCLTQLPVAVRPVKQGESFARLTDFSQKPFHESYKKICQRYQIPSWERGMGRVLMWHDVTMALLLPRHSFWLTDASKLAKRGAFLTEEFLSKPCVWYIEPDVMVF